MNTLNKIARLIILLALMVSVLIMQTGCVSVWGVFAHTKEEGTPKPFLGTQISAVGVVYAKAPLSLFFLIDLPFSAVADIVFLPIVLPWYIAHGNLVEDRKKNDALAEKEFEKQVIAAGGHKHWIRTGAFSPDSTKMATSDGTTLKIWDVSGPLLKTVPLKIGGPLVFGPRGDMIAGSDYQNNITIWNMDGKLLATLKGHKKGIEGIVFSPDGQKLASSSDDETVRIWTTTGKTLATLNIRWAKKAMAFSPASDSLITGGERFDTNAGSSASVIDKYPDKLQHWNLDGTLIQAWDGYTVAVKFLTSSKFMTIDKRLPGYERNNQSMRVRYIDIKSGRIEKIILLNQNREITENEHIISQNKILGCFNKYGGDGCKLFNIHGEVLQTFNSEHLHGALSICAVSPDGQMLATNYKQVLSIWSINDPEKKIKIPDVKTEPNRTEPNRTKTKQNKTKQSKIK